MKLQRFKRWSRVNAATCSYVQSKGVCEAQNADGGLDCAAVEGPSPVFRGWPESLPFGKTAPWKMAMSVHSHFHSFLPFLASCIMNVVGIIVMLSQDKSASRFSCARLNIGTAHLAMQPFQLLEPKCATFCSRKRNPRRRGLCNFVIEADCSTCLMKAFSRNPAAFCCEGLGITCRFGGPPDKPRNSSSRPGQRVFCQPPCKRASHWVFEGCLD